VGQKSPLGRLQVFCTELVKRDQNDQKETINREVDSVIDELLTVPDSLSFSEPIVNSFDQKLISPNDAPQKVSHKIMLDDQKSEQNAVQKRPNSRDRSSMAGLLISVKNLEKKES